MRKEHRQAVAVFFLLIAAWLTTIVTVQVLQSIHYTR